jgi:hypothetical protein
MIKSIISFYINPYSNFFVGENETARERIILFKKLFIFCLFSTLSIGMLIVLIETVLEAKFNVSIIKYLSDGRKEFRTINSPFMASFKICLLGPFEEEILFRLPLILRSKISIFFIIILVVDRFFLQFLPAIFFPFYYNSILAFLAIITFEKSPDKDFSKIFDKRNYNYLCWGLTIAFASAHIGNFTPLNWSFIYLYPVYVFPQFVYGIVLSYLAIRYKSIIWPFLLHVAINSTSEVPKLLAKLF